MPPNRAKPTHSAPEPSEEPAEEPAEDMEDPITKSIEEQRRHFIEWADRHGYSNREIAKTAKLTEGPIRRYRKEYGPNLKLENKIKIAQGFGVSLAEIFGDVPGATDETARSSESTVMTNGATSTVPVIARAHGTDLIETRHPVAYISVPPEMALDRNVYAIRVPNTHNMPRFRIHETLLFEPTTEIEPGDDCAIHTTDGYVHILRCLEYDRERGFTGTTYADPGTKVQFPADAIRKTALFAGLLRGF